MLGDLLAQDDKSLGQGLKTLVIGDVSGDLIRLLGGNVAGELLAAQVPLQNEVGAMGDRLAVLVAPQEMLAESAATQSVNYTHFFDDLFPLLLQNSEGGFHGLVISLQI